MGTPYNPERDPEGLYARPSKDDVKRVLPRPVAASRRSAANIPDFPDVELPRAHRSPRPADDFAWQDFLKTVRETTEQAVNPVIDSPHPKS
jgi:hypothetical protein